jgi:galactokinase
MGKRELIEKAAVLFNEQFPEHAGKPLVYGIAPGRIEILGNHTDYNEGYVLSAAIDKYTVMVGIPVQERKVIMHSQSMGTSVEFELDDRTPFPKESNDSWANYPKGVIREMNPPSGFVALILSTVPLGAGVSSSAALELATASFLQAAFPSHSLASMSKLEVALLCKKAENEFVGMRCGILDQFTSALGKEVHLIFLDCRNLQHVTYVPLPRNYSFVVVESAAPHQLVDGKYNGLRRKCFEAANKLGHAFLRDITSEELVEKEHVLPEDLRRIASHIVHENQRVLRAVEILGSLEEIRLFGQLLSDSHKSSQYDFQNSCPEIDVLIDCAQRLPGFIGGRIQGGGFGGSTINCCDSSTVEMFQDLISRAYFERTGLSCTSFVVTPGSGASSGKV